MTEKELLKEVLETIIDNLTMHNEYGRERMEIMNTAHRNMTHDDVDLIQSKMKKIDQSFYNYQKVVISKFKLMLKGIDNIE